LIRHRITFEGKRNVSFQKIPYYIIAIILI